MHEHGAAPDWRSALQRFVESYRCFAAGCEHSLYLIRKGFADIESKDEALRLFGDLGPIPIDVADEGFNLGAYIETGGRLPERFICLLNSYSEILSSFWLEKLWINLNVPGVGMVSATASFESNGVHPDVFPPFPNPHLRSNAFMISRQMFLEMAGKRRIESKEDAWRLESGRDGLSAQVRERGLGLILVGRNGRGYSPHWWPSSGIFRQGLQQNVLIADNQTRGYAALAVDAKPLVAQRTWGPYLAPMHCPSVATTVPSAL